ncbi:MAG: CRISPR-associated helicase Cas3' [Fusobacteriaceae bacterium]
MILNKIDEIDKFYAHISDQKIEKLEEHINLTKKYAQKIIDSKNLGLIIEKIGKKNFKKQEDYDLWYEMFLATIEFHDIGKINENFQVNKMKNKNFKTKSNFTTNHSFLSSKIYLDFYFEKANNSAPEMLIFLFINIYIISKHHGSLDSFDKFINDLPTEYENLSSKKELYSFLKFEAEISNLEKKGEWFKDELKEYSKDWKCIELYIYTKLLFSLLVSSDFYATSEFMNNSEINEFGTLNDVDKYFDALKNTEVFKNIDAYRNSKEIGEDFSLKTLPINILRSELFLETEKNLKKYENENIYFLEAPTGSGKTICSINLALNLLQSNKNLNKLLYVFPFNTLVEQTSETLKEIFGEKIYKEDISIINSTTPILNETEERISLENGKDIDYSKLLLDRQFIHSPIILTTHVNFFNYLFGLDREAHFPLLQIANSVVIIDEIQAYKNSIWKEIAIFLDYFSKVLNIKFIIMSATLPKIDKLIQFDSQKEIFKPLLSNRDKYFKNDLFCKRVEVNYELLEELKDFSTEEKLENLSYKTLDYYNEGKKVLIEFITKKSAVKFFNLLIQTTENINLELITGDDNKIERKEIINKVKNEDRAIILVSTQVIEAGVDIDMDIGFKNISIVDSEEQFLGRINRSCKKSGKVYFFEVDEGKKVYRGDVRSRDENSLVSKNIKLILENKNFAQYYESVLNSLEKESIKNNLKNIELFRTESLNNLNFKNIENRLRLIDEKDEVSIFLNREIEHNGVIIKGSQVWKEYRDILQNNIISYSEKKIKLSSVMEKMNYFIYKVRTFNKSYTENIGSIFYIENAENYFVKFAGKLKFNREEFEGEKSVYEFI